MISLSLAICSGADWNFYDCLGIGITVRLLSLGDAMGIRMHVGCTSPCQYGVSFVYCDRFSIASHLYSYAGIPLPLLKLPILYLMVVGAGLVIALTKLDRCKGCLPKKKRWSVFCTASKSGLVFDRFSAEWFKFHSEVFSFWTMVIMYLCDDLVVFIPMRSIWLMD